MRSLAEWLLLPLFLLPLLVGVGLGLWARERHRAEVERVRVGGAEVARRWLATPDGPAAWMPAEAVAAFRPGRSLRGQEIDWIPFVHPTGLGEVWLPGTALGRTPWVIHDAYPAGLTSDALADEDVRLRIEVGTTPVRVARVDEATTVLADLLDAPDLATLRQAPLPAATKLFLVSRWEKRGAVLAWLPAARRLLTVLRDFEHEAGAAGVALPTGAHRMDAGLAMSTGGAEPLLLYPDAHAVLPHSVFWEGGREEDPVRLVWTFPPDATVPETVEWSGELEAPLAGRWRWVSKYGDAWWNAPRVRRWAGPVLLFLAAFLVLPIALLVSMRRRRRQEEARVRFLNELAHDLRTPLTSLRLHAELLARGTNDPAKRSRYEATVTREAARLSGLLANVLDLSRLERGKRSLETVSLSVASAVGQAVSEFVATHPEREGDVQLEGPDDTEVVADPSALGRVLANLLDNAGKFTEPGTPIALRWNDAGARTRIVVADEGPGIPAGEEQRVFDRYVRGQRSARVPGTGLGLSLVRELVQEMDGTVVLLPSSRGAVFEIRLPEPKHA